MSVTDHQNIEWRQVDDSNGYYQVSNHGDVRSLDRTLICGRRVPGKVLKKSKVRGYEVVSICVDGSKKSMKVHRLVASSFLENPDCKSTVNHVNGNKINNNISNLEWATPKEQVDHTYKYLKNRGRSLLSESQVLTILTYKKLGNTKTLSEWANVKMVTIQKIKKGVSYKRIYREAI